MGRIEISIEEYNGLKEKIKSLNSTVSDLSKKVSAYQEQIAAFFDTLDNVSFIKRVFQWQNTVGMLNTILKK